MKEEIKNRLIEISKNLNGNHKRTIKDLEEVIDNLKEDQKYQRRTRNIKIITNVFLVVLLFGGVYAGITYVVNDEPKLMVSENETRITNLLKGEGQLKIFYDGMSFLDEKEKRLFSIFSYNSSIQKYPISEVFNGSVVFSNDNVGNQYNMEICFWDNGTQSMSLCIDAGAIGNGRATTVQGSFQIVDKQSNENFTKCEGTYIDCNSSLTNPDLYVQGDIEAVGNLYVGGLMTGGISLGSSLVNVSGGNITYETFYMSVLGEGGLNDEINYILGGSEGDVLNIFPTSGDSDIKLKHGTGNLDLGGADCNLKSIGTKAELRKNNGGWNLIVCLA